MSPSEHLPQAPVRRRNRRGEGNRLREELIEAAEQLIIEVDGDVARLSMRAVARRAGVTPMAPYLHFADLDDLVWAVLQRGWADLRIACLDAAERERGTPVDRLRAAATEFCRWGREHPGTFAVLFTSLTERATGADPQDLPGAAFVRDWIELVDASGPVQDGRCVALAILVALYGLVTLQGTRRHFPWPPEPEMIEVVLAGHLAIPEG